MSVGVTVVLALIGLFALFVVVPRVMMVVQVRKMQGKSAPTVHKPSAQRIRSGSKTILYFYTPSCGVCRSQDPIVKKVQQRYPDAVFKIDASTQREAAKAYGVMGVPFLAFIEGGKLVAARAGLQRESAMLGFLSGGTQST